MGPLEGIGICEIKYISKIYKTLFIKQLTRYGCIQYTVKGEYNESIYKQSTCIQKMK
jgi:hypothetical protein